LKHLIQFAAAAVLVTTPVLAQSADDERFGAKGYVPTHQAAHTSVRRGIPEDHYKGVKSNYPVRSQVTYSDYACPQGFTGMWRGTLYCVDGKLFP